MSCYEILTVSLQSLTLIFLAIYVAKTWAIAQSNREMVDANQELIRVSKSAKELEYAPYIITRFDFEHNIGNLIVKNIGKTPAWNVKIKINPDIIGLFPDDDVRDLHIKHWKKVENEGIRQIVPNEEIRIFVNVSPTIFAKSKDNYKYEINTVCSGGLSKKEHSFSVSVDIEEELNRPTALLPDNKIKDIVKSIKELNRIIKEKEIYS